MHQFYKYWKEMRRSAAPSITSSKALPSAKRGKFSTPFKSPEVRKLPISLEAVAQEDGNSSQDAKESPEKENVPIGEAFHEKGHVETEKEPFAFGETLSEKPVPKFRTKTQFQCNRAVPIHQVKVQGREMQWACPTQCLIGLPLKPGELGDSTHKRAYTFGYLLKTVELLEDKISFF